MGRNSICYVEGASGRGLRASQSDLRASQRGLRASRISLRTSRRVEQRSGCFKTWGDGRTSKCTDGRIYGNSSCSTGQKERKLCKIKGTEIISKEKEQNEIESSRARHSKIVKGKKRERIKNDTIKRANGEQFEREENLVLD